MFTFTSTKQTSIMKTYLITYSDGTFLMFIAPNKTQASVVGADPSNSIFISSIDEVNNPLGIGEPRNSFKYKFADEDAKKSNERFRKMGNNADKLNALKASIERGRNNA